jgi:hypothetical protein
MKADPVYRKATGIGSALGLIFGAALHNFAVGLGIGAAIGAAFAAYAKRKGLWDDFPGASSVIDRVINVWRRWIAVGQ